MADSKKILRWPPSFIPQTTSFVTRKEPCKSNRNINDTTKKDERSIDISESVSPDTSIGVLCLQWTPRPTRCLVLRIASDA
jgi:hypothetical protein